jgi:hypothetical protein
MGRASLRYAAGTGTHRLDGERWCVGAMNAHALTVNSESTRPTGGYGNEVQGSGGSGHRRQFFTMARQASDVAGIWLFPSVAEMRKISAGANTAARPGCAVVHFDRLLRPNHPQRSNPTGDMTNALPCARYGLRRHGSPR